MTVPLMLLAVLSSIGGFMGVPESLLGSDRVGEFLDPVFGQSLQLMQHRGLNHATEYMLMGTVISLTLVIILLAYNRYVSKQHLPAEEGAALGSLHQLIYRKYFVDELYQTVIVNPLYGISRMFFDVIERSGIDRLVNSLGSNVGRASKVMRLLQNGNIGFYIFIMVISIILLLATNTIMK